MKLSDIRMGQKVYVIHDEQVKEAYIYGMKNPVTDILSTLNMPSVKIAIDLVNEIMEIANNIVESIELQLIKIPNMISESIIDSLPIPSLPFLPQDMIDDTFETVVKRIFNLDMLSFILMKDMSFVNLSDIKSFLSFVVDVVTRNESGDASIVTLASSRVFLTRKDAEDAFQATGIKCLFCNRDFKRKERIPKSRICNVCYKTLNSLLNGFLKFDIVEYNGVELQAVVIEAIKEYNQRRESDDVRHYLTDREKLANFKLLSIDNKVAKFKAIKIPGSRKHKMVFGMYNSRDSIRLDKSRSILQAYDLFLDGKFDPSSIQVNRPVDTSLIDDRAKFLFPSLLLYTDTGVDGVIKFSMTAKEHTSISSIEVIMNPLHSISSKTLYKISDRNTLINMVPGFVETDKVNDKKETLFEYSMPLNISKGDVYTGSNYITIRVKFDKSVYSDLTDVRTTQNLYRQLKKDPAMTRYFSSFDDNQYYESHMQFIANDSNVKTMTLEFRPTLESDTMEILEEVEVYKNNTNVSKYFRTKTLTYSDYKYEYAYNEYIGGDIDTGMIGIQDEYRVRKKVYSTYYRNGVMNLDKTQIIEHDFLQYNTYNDLDFEIFNTSYIFFKPSLRRKSYYTDGKTEQTFDITLASKYHIDVIGVNVLFQSSNPFKTNVSFARYVKLDKAYECFMGTAVTIPVKLKFDDGIATDEYIVTADIVYQLHTQYDGSVNITKPSEFIPNSPNYSAYNIFDSTNMFSYSLINIRNASTGPFDIHGELYIDPILLGNKISNSRKLLFKDWETSTDLSSAFDAYEKKMMATIISSLQSIPGVKNVTPISNILDVDYSTSPVIMGESYDSIPIGNTRYKISFDYINQPNEYITDEKKNDTITFVDMMKDGSFLQYVNDGLIKSNVLFNVKAPTEHITYDEKANTIGMQLDVGFSYMTMITFVPGEIVWPIMPVVQNTPVHFIFKSFLTSISYDNPEIVNETWQNIPYYLLSAKATAKVLQQAIPSGAENIPPDMPTMLYVPQVYDVDKIFKTYDEAKKHVLWVFCPICRRFKKPTDDTNAKGISDFINELKTSTLNEKNAYRENTKNYLYLDDAVNNYQKRSNRILEVMYTVNGRDLPKTEPESKTIDDLGRPELEASVYDRKNPYDNNFYSNDGKQQGFEINNKTYTINDIDDKNTELRQKIVDGRKVEPSNTPSYVEQNNAYISKKKRVYRDYVNKKVDAVDKKIMNKVTDVFEWTNNKYESALNSVNDFVKDKFNIDLMDLGILFGKLDLPGTVKICSACQRKIIQFLKDLLYDILNLFTMNIKSVNIRIKKYIDVQFDGDTTNFKSFIFNMPETEYEKEIIRNKVKEILLEIEA